jgi:hypothetical protein
MWKLEKSQESGWGNLGRLKGDWEREVGYKRGNGCVWWDQSQLYALMKMSLRNPPFCASKICFY